MNLAEDRVPTYGQAFVRDIGIVVPHTTVMAYYLFLIFSGEYDPATLTQRDDAVWLQHLGVLALTWYLLEIATMLTNRKRRALHDFIAGTVVVKTS